MKYLVQFSGGITSWAAAKRVAQIHGVDGMTLLFADTLIEDEDNYRFLEEAAANIGAPLVRIADGRTPWEVMRKERIIGNSRIDPCSKILKRKLLETWRSNNADPFDTTLVFGVLWDEAERIERLSQRIPEWKCWAPLCEKPWISKNECLAWAKREGLTPPRLYDMGFPHANCGGFCIKGGQQNFKLLLHNFPERYAEHERQEEAMRDLVGDHAIMKETKGGVTKPLTMRALRERIQSGGQCDAFDLGGCGCAIDEEEQLPAA